MTPRERLPAAGDDAQAQLSKWRLVVALTNEGRPDLAMEVLCHQHEKLAGSSLLGPLLERERVDDSFFARYEAAGWHTTADLRYNAPNVQQHEVALLSDDPQGGRVKVRGRLTADRPKSPHFHLDGYDQRFNLNLLPAFAYKP